jgi:hypothetical protein
VKPCHRDNSGQSEPSQDSLITERVGFDLKTYGYVLERVWTVLTLVSNEITHNISHKQARFNDVEWDFLAQESAELDGKGGFWRLTETRS